MHRPRYNAIHIGEMAMATVQVALACRDSSATLLRSQIELANLDLFLRHCSACIVQVYRVQVERTVYPMGLSGCWPLVL